MRWTDDGLRAMGFTGFVPFAGLPASAVPADGGIYVVIRPATSAPVFDSVSTAGRFQGKDPSVGIDVLAEKWVQGAQVVYIGKAGAGGARPRGLRARLDEYRRFGAGEAVGHWGGRLIWQLQDRDDLLVAWLPTGAEDPGDAEHRLLEAFLTDHGTLPFANWNRGTAGSTTTTDAVAETDGAHADRVAAVSASRIREILKQLAVERPAFHSEADFQHAFAAALARDSSLRVRLEMPYAAISADPAALAGRADLVCSDPARHALTVIEFKHPTRRWDGVVAGERFRVLNHSATDLGRLGFVTDIRRLEASVQAYGGNGFAIMLTNEPEYWTDRGATTAQDRHFRIHDGAHLEGDLLWDEGRVPAKTKHLSGSYDAHWSDYAAQGSPHNPEDPLPGYRYLVLEVEPVTGGAEHATALGIDAGAI